MNEKQAQARSKKMRERAEKMLTELWPGIDPRWFWDPSKAKGYTRLPRTLIYVMNIIDALYELSRRSLDILLELLAEDQRGRPRPQAVPPSPDQVRRSHVVSNHRRRCRAERRDAERGEASKLEATWPQVTEAETTAEPNWFIPVETLPATPTVTPRSKGGMP